MKYLKTYEGVRDEMIPKSKEKIKEDLMNLSPDEKLNKGYDYSISWLVKIGLEEGGDISGNLGELLLEDACMNGRLDIVKLLLERGVDADTPDALTHACVAGHTSIVSLLLDKGADPNFNFGEPLKKAAEVGNLDCVKLLLLHGAEMKWADSYIEKLRPNVAEYLLHYKRRGFLGKFKDYMKHRFTNESVRDKMTPKSKEDIKNELSKTSPHRLLGKLSEMDIKLTDVYTEEEILELDPEVLLEYSFWNNYVKGIKYVLDNYKLYGKDTKFTISCHMPDIKDNGDLKYLLNQEQIRKILSSDEIYVLEKYRLGMHKGEIREYEQILIDVLEKAEYNQSVKDNDIMICEGEGEYELYFNYNKRTHKLRYHLDNFGGYLKEGTKDGDSKYGFGVRYDNLLIAGVVGEFCDIIIDSVDGARGNKPSKSGQYENFIWD